MVQLEVVRGSTTDVMFFVWTDDAHNNGIRILFGTQGIQKSLITDGVYTQQWLIS